MVTASSSLDLAIDLWYNVNRKKTNMNDVTPDYMSAILPTRVFGPGIPDPREGPNHGHPMSEADFDSILNDIWTVKENWLLGLDTGDKNKGTLREGLKIGEPIHYVKMEARYLSNGEVHMCEIRRIAIVELRSGTAVKARATPEIVGEDANGNPIFLGTEPLITFRIRRQDDGMGGFMPPGADWRDSLDSAYEPGRTWIDYTAGSTERGKDHVFDNATSYTGLLVMEAVRAAQAATS
jgi:hypothetical protein